MRQGLWLGALQLFRGLLCVGLVLPAVRLFQ
jgi:hypothetical protein